MVMKKDEAFENLIDEQFTLNGEDPAEKPEIVQPQETMEDYAAELEASYRKVYRGDVMTGTVLSVDEEGLMLDLNYFTPGKVPPEEISNDPNSDWMHTVKVGDEVKAEVLSTDDGSGYMVLSVKNASIESAWNKLREKMKSGEVVVGRVSETNPAGAVVYVEGIRGFVPISKLDIKFVEDTSVFMGKTLELNVIEANEDDDRLVLSARDILYRREIDRRNEKANKIAVDSVVEGTVEEIKDYGAFVGIGDGLSGLLHISQISSQRVKNPRAVLSVGQKVRVKIIKVENGKISLSMKALEEATAHEVEEDAAVEYISGEEATTSFASLLKGIKLD